LTRFVFRPSKNDRRPCVIQKNKKRNVNFLLN
jgi:hypothetical protein